MSNNERIKRVGDFKYEAGHFKGFRVQGLYMDGKVGRDAPTACAWLDSFGLVVRHSEKKIALVTVETVASAAVEMARDIPELRRALIAELTAMEQPDPVTP